MFSARDSRLSASNSAVLASQSFLIPMTLVSEAKTSEAAAGSLKSAFEEIQRFAAALTKLRPGLNLISFENPISPRMSRIEATVSGKDRQFDLTFAIECPIPKDHDFWARLELLSMIYDQFAELAERLHDRKGLALVLSEAKL